MRHQVSAVSLLAVPAGTRVAWWVEFATYATSLRAVEAYPGSVEWHEITAVEDDDTYVIVTSRGEQWGIHKGHEVVIDTGTPGAVNG